MSAKPDQVIVYLGQEQKKDIKYVAYHLGVSQSALLFRLAYPQIRKLKKAIEAGASPQALKEKVMS